MPGLTLIGHSWGAWLVLLTAARDPTLARQLIQVSSGPFDAGYVSGMQETRMGRLDDEQRSEFVALVSNMNDVAGAEKDSYLARLGELVSRSDDFDPIPDHRRDISTDLAPGR